MVALGLRRPLRASRPGLRGAKEAPSLGGGSLPPVLGPIATSFTAGAASGSLITAITGLSSGETIASVSPNDGRVAISSGSGLFVGLTASSAGTISYTLSTSLGRTLTVAVTANAQSSTYTGPAVGTYSQNSAGFMRNFYEWAGVVPPGAFGDAHAGRGDYVPPGQTATAALAIQDWESADYSLTASNWIGAGREMRIAIPMFPKIGTYPDGSGGSFANALSGKYDNSITTIAQKIHNALKDTQDEYHIRFGWEMNGNFQPWAIMPQGGNAVDATMAAQYVTWWKKARTLFKAVSPKFKMNFCVNLGSFDYRAAWPGEDQVDYIGMDVYPAIGDRSYRAPNVISDATQTTLFNNTLNRSFGLSDIAAFASSKGKPLTIPEFGIEFDNGGTFLSLFWNWMVTNKVKDIGWWSDHDTNNVVSDIAAGDIPATGEFVRNKINPIGYPARINITPALNWRLTITGAVTDSAGDATTQTAVQQSAANKKHAIIALAAGQTRTLTIPVAAVAAPGGLVYLNVDKSNSIVYSSDTGVTATVEISRDNAATYSALNLAQGDTLDRGRAYAIPSGAAGLIRITLANTAAGNVAMNAYLGIFQLPSSGRIDSWGIWGASFQAFGAHPRRYTDAIQAKNPGSDPIVFNRGVSGTTAKMISDRVISELPSFPYLSFVELNQGGNTLGPASRPIVPANGDFLNIGADTTAMYNAAKSRNLIVLGEDISYRDLSPVYVADNTAPENGAYRVNRDVLWPLFASINPDMYDPITGVARANEYGLFMYLRDTILNQNDQHPQDGYVALNNMHADVFGAYIYGRLWPENVCLTAIKKLEADKTIDAKNRAFELLQMMPGNTAQSAYTKAVYQRRLDAITVALPTMTTAPTISGTPQVGQVLTLTFGVGNNTPLGLNWVLRRDDGTVAASGVAPRRGVFPDGTNYATRPYTCVAADSGRTLKLETTPYNGQGPGTMSPSAATGQVQPASSGTAPTLGTLALSPNTATAGTAYTGTLSGATSGSDVAITGMTVSGTGTTRSVTGTPSSAGSLNAVETLSGATGSPKTTTGILTVAASGGTGTARVAQSHMALSTPAGVPNWTDVDVSAAVTAASAVALPDTTGAATGWKIYKLSGSQPTYQNFAVPPAPKVYPDGVYAGIYGSKGSPIVMRLTGLNPAKSYKIEVLGNRGSGGSGRVSDYSVNGVTITQDNSDNGNRVATFSSVLPTSGGTIDVTCDGNTASTSFWYLNTIVVTESP